jgi:hypothetical protein
MKYKSESIDCKFIEQQTRLAMCCLKVTGDVKAWWPVAGVCIQYGYACIVNRDRSCDSSPNPVQESGSRFLFLVLSLDLFESRDEGESVGGPGRIMSLFHCSPKLVVKRKFPSQFRTSSRTYSWFQQNAEAKSLETLYV